MRQEVTTQQCRKCYAHGHAMTVPSTANPGTTKGLIDTENEARNSNFPDEPAVLGFVGMNEGHTSATTTRLSNTIRQANDDVAAFRALKTVVFQSKTTVQRKHLKQKQRTLSILLT